MALTIANGRYFFRELIQEPSPSVPTDDKVDYYLQMGLNATNRAIKYHYTDYTLQLIAGQMEYTIPTGFVEMVWVEFLNNFLQKTDMNELRNRMADYRTVTPQAPLEYAIYGRTIIFTPTPTAQDAAQSLQPLLRFVSAPGTYAQVGFEQLSDQDCEIPVYYAAAKFSATRPNVLMAAERSALLMTDWQQQTGLVQAQYQARLLGM